MKPILPTMVAATALVMLLVMGAPRAQQAPDATAEAAAESEDEGEGRSEGWIAATVTDIDRYGARYRQPFIDEIVRYHGAPRELVVDLLESSGWTPADVYYACAI